MKIEQQMEANKLIAEFMGAEVLMTYKVTNHEYFSVKGAIVKEWRNSGLFTGGYEGSMMLENCKFHTSWDWLMPVVEKIEILHDDFHGYFGVYISSNTCTIQGTRFNPSEEAPHYAYFNCITLNSKIESTYRMCVRFIEWYNTKNLNL